MRAAPAPRRTRGSRVAGEEGAEGEGPWAPRRADLNSEGFGDLRKARLGVVTHALIPALARQRREHRHKFEALHRVLGQFGLCSEALSYSALVEKVRVKSHQILNLCVRGPLGLFWERKDFGG